MSETVEKSFLIRLGFILSGMACSALLMQTESKLSFAITLVLAMGVMCILVFRTRLIGTVLSEKTPAVYIISGVLSCVMVYYAKSTFYTCCKGWIKSALNLLSLPEFLLRLIPWGVALVALPVIFCYLVWFLSLMWKEAKAIWETSDFAEQMYLLCAGILFAVVICFAYTCTQAFYGAHISGNWYNFDLIYSADSGYLVFEDVFRNVGASQNDLRQPLFGVFSAPFATAAWLVSRVIFFIPKSYVLVLQILEMFLFLVSCVLLSRMLGLKKVDKVLFLVLLSVSYPVLIFSLTAEQYLFAVFYLILMIYHRGNNTLGNFGYVAATGSMLTTGIFFPLLTWEKDLKRFVKNTLYLCLCFFGVMILSGRLTTFLDAGTYIDGYAPYAGGDVAPLAKLMQYVNFVGACIAAPASWMDFETYNHVSWQMIPVVSWNWLGIAVFLLSALGVAVDRQDGFGRICGVWILFSLVLLGIVGWGTVDNGLMLYTLYFGWAFIAMGYRFVIRVFQKYTPVKVVILLMIILCVMVLNVRALRSVLVFATQFYPALR